MGDRGSFSTSYAQARQKFLDAATHRGLAVRTTVLPAYVGKDGEVLAQDAALLGDKDAAALLVVSSGMHGIEGYCGSGCQTGIIGSPLADALVRSGVAVLFVHAINPHGFSYGSRVNEDNVDLNRNFHDFSGPLPRNPAYAELHPLLVTDAWPPPEPNERALAQLAAVQGTAAFQAAVSSGQHSHPDGLFYGGRQSVWSNRSLRETLAHYGAGRRHVAWIDLHTGLGPCGHGERILSDRDDTAKLARARAWWGAEVKSVYDGSSSSAALTGMAWQAIESACPDADYVGIALEFGTVAIMEVVQALRADNWLRLHPDADDGKRQAIKAAIRRAFYVETDAWRRQVFEQTVAAVTQGVLGLASLLRA